MRSETGLTSIAAATGAERTRPGRRRRPRRKPPGRCPAAGGARLGRAVALCAFLGAGGAALAVGGTELADVSRPLPEFALESLDGERYETSTLAGKPWIVNFWASWCAPCIEEIPAMNRAWEALEPAGVGMLAINVGETPEAIARFTEETPIDFPVLLGDGATTMPDFGARVLPTTLVIDAGGRVVHEALGPREWDDAALVARIAAMADGAASGD